MRHASRWILCLAWFVSGCDTGSAPSPSAPTVVPPPPVLAAPHWYFNVNWRVPDVFSPISAGDVINQRVTFRGSTVRSALRGPLPVLSLRGVDAMACSRSRWRGSHCKPTRLISTSPIPTLLRGTSRSLPRTRDACSFASRAEASTGSASGPPPHQASRSC